MDIAFEYYVTITGSINSDDDIVIILDSYEDVCSLVKLVTDNFGTAYVVRETAK